MMKRNNVLFMMMMLLLSVATLSLVSCGKDDDDDDDNGDPLLEARLAELEGSWVQTSVTQNGDEPQYEITTNPTLVFTVDLDARTGTYSVTDGHYVFPDASGTLEFVPQTQYNAIDFGDFTATASVDGNTLTITRQVDEEIGPGAARVATIGDYDMVFEKQ